MPLADPKVVLENLDSQSLRDVLTKASGITDPLSIELIQQLADAHSPIWADSLPDSKFAKFQQLSNLDRLVDLNVAQSEMARHGNSYVRKYRITDFGRKVSSLVNKKV